MLLVCLLDFVETPPIQCIYYCEVPSSRFQFALFCGNNTHTVYLLLWTTLLSISICFVLWKHHPYSVFIIVKYVTLDFNLLCFVETPPIQCIYYCEVRYSRFQFALSCFVETTPIQCIYYCEVRYSRFQFALFCGNNTHTVYLLLWNTLLSISICFVLWKHHRYSVFIIVKYIPLDFNLLCFVETTPIPYSVLYLLLWSTFLSISICFVLWKQHTYSVFIIVKYVTLDFNLLLKSNFVCLFVTSECSLQSFQICFEVRSGDLRWFNSRQADWLVHLTSQLQLTKQLKSRVIIYNQNYSLYVWYKIMLIYINFKFNFLTKYHSHQDVSHAIYNIRVRVASNIRYIQHGRSCCI
jgi:NADH:ubiquinone oxidoreductase subunit 6 (subunit J)